MTNRFKTPLLSATYGLYARLYRERAYPLYTKQGEPSRGNAARNAFWNGFDGYPNISFPKNSASYAAYRAGQDCAKP